MSDLETEPPTRAERHLAAILAVDIVGYSRQMEHDEVGTLRRLGDLRRNLIEPKVAEHRGRIFKTMGDGFLAEFGSVLEAVYCAVDIQRWMAARNLDLPEGGRLLLRMGINLGDVFYEGSDVFGDGVNIAARLEGIAPPGGIYVSRAAFDSVRERLAFDFEDLGEHQVKNIARPIHVFGVRLEAADLGERSAPQASAKPVDDSAGNPSRQRHGGKSFAVVAVLAVIALIIVGAGSYLGKSPIRQQATIAPSPAVQPDPAEQPAPALQPQPAAQAAIDPDIVLWLSIAASDSGADFEEYLRKYPDGRFAGLARNRLAALQAPPAVAPEPQPPAPQPLVQSETTSTAEQRREVQRALRLLGNYQGEADGGFGPGTQAAIKQFQTFAGLPQTGTLSEDERKRLLEMAQRLSALLDQPPESPQGVTAGSIKGSDLRYVRGWNYETGKGVKADPGEAAYWYALAAGDGKAMAFTNLGTLTARGWRSTKPNPVDAALLWWAAAARDEPIAMYNLGVLYERGIGVAPDIGLAKGWYQRAAAFSDPSSRAALKRLGG